MPPEFTKEVYSISVNESNQAAGFPRPQNGFITVICVDSTTNSTPIAITYTILDGSLPFGIDDSSGALSVTQDLDYDTPPRSYEFNVSCYNGSSPELNSTALMRITLDPVNDNIPVLSRNSFQVLITEVTPAGTVLASTQPGAIQMYSVTDADIGEGGDVVFMLSESSEDPEFFTLNMDNGNLVLSQTIDIDSTNRTIIGGFIRFSTRITVCDTIPPSEQCPNLLVEVLELPVNDHLPQFSNDSYLASFPETTATGTVLVVAACTDGDRPGTTGSFSGIMLSNPTPNVVDHFMVDDATGSISLIQELDYEMDQMFNFAVLCSDTGGLTTSARVIIDVIPENDNFPLFTNSTMGTFSYNFSLSRTAPIGFVIGQVRATDADVGTTTEITYGIEPNEYFNIETTTGVITVSNSIVDSTADILTINVTVSDGTLSSSALVSVEVTSGNFDQPEFQRDNVTRQISELIPVGTTIETLLCIDADMGSNAEISYSINSVSGLFEINSTSGALMVAMPLFPSNNDSAIVTYTLNISCEDNGIPVFSDSTLSFVQVYRRGSNLGSRPMISEHIAVQALSESTLINTVVISTERDGLKQFTVTDVDPGDKIVFTLNTTTSSPNVPRFSFNHTTGALVVTQSLDVDSLGGMMDTIIFSITACDLDPPVVECPSVQVTITISASNDNSPQFSEEFYRVSYFTVTPVGTVLLTANCTDADRGVGRFSGIEFSSTNPPDNPQMYGLDDQTGVLTLLQPFQSNMIHMFTLRCFDTGPRTPANEDTAVVTIDVMRNDPPVFTAERYNVTFSEDLEVGSLIAQLSCNDNEKQFAGYELLNPSTAVEETFALSNSGEITLRKSFDICEQTSYEFQVVCMDDANQMDNATVEISVGRGAIAFEHCTYTFEFDRLTMPNSGEEIGQVRAIGRGIIEYSLDNNEFFVIDATGRIFSSNYILLFQGNTINLQVQARTSIGQANDTTNVTINVRGPLSFLEIYIIAAAGAALILILLICSLFACCCCCFRKDKVKT